MPYRATSSPAGDVTYGSRMNVAGWAKRGDAKPSRGCGCSGLLIVTFSLAEALLDPRHRRHHVDAGGEDGREGIGHLLEALRHRGDGEAGGIQARRHLAPRERARGGRAGQRAEGKRPDDGLAVAVLTEV